MIAKSSHQLCTLIALGLYSLALGCSCSDDSGTSDEGSSGAANGDSGTAGAAAEDGLSGGGGGDAGSTGSGNGGAAGGAVTGSGNGGAAGGAVTGSGDGGAAGGAVTGAAGGAGTPASGSSGAAGRIEGGGGSTGLGGAVNYAGMVNAPTVIDGQVYCGPVVCMCNDGIDNDEDGTVDGFDVECTGPYDNDESAFATGIPGDNSDPKWQDCFFDGNSGAGDDGCRYHTDCLTGDLPMTDPNCTLADDCVEFCAPRTPPGCDCFGCCQVTDTDGTLHTVQIGGTCDYENIEACPECVQTTSCINECGECEICAGKTVEDLPESCYVSGGSGGAGGAGSGGATGAAGSGGGGGSTSTGGSTGWGGTSSSGGSTGTEPPPPPNACDNSMEACNEDWPCYGSGFCLQGCCYYLY